jgi:hypothetical protein
LPSPRHDAPRRTSGRPAGRPTCASAGNGACSSPARRVDCRNRLPRTGGFRGEVVKKCLAKSVKSPRVCIRGWTALRRRIGSTRLVASPRTSRG